MSPDADRQRGEPLPTLLVTGGAGFIGSNFVRSSVACGFARVVTLDKLTYAGSVANLAEVEGDDRHRFVEGDICDGPLVAELLRDHRPSAIVHFAAESHVDRSIDGPGGFIQTNVVGTFTLLEAARRYVESLAESDARRFRFLHVSTDEVFGSLGPAGHFREGSPYAPSSPYSASKAASDLFVRAWSHTYRLPSITTNCSNNYGPYQFPEKLIPLVVLNCLEGKPLPVYGDGRNVRDWPDVGDHCEGIRLALARGEAGATYLFGGRSERANIDIVTAICDIVDDLTERAPGESRRLITFVEDRPGHDFRYAVEPTKAERALGWKRSCTFEEGLRRTVRWYLDNRAWCADVTATRYGRERLGLLGPASAARARDEPPEGVAIGGPDCPGPAKLDRHEPR